MENELHKYNLQVFEERICNCRKTWHHMTDMDEEIAIKHLEHCNKGSKWGKNYTGSHFLHSNVPSNQVENMMQSLRSLKIPYSKGLTNGRHTTFSVKISDVMKVMEPAIYTASKLGIL